jgi:hypothetical protein
MDLNNNNHRKKKIIKSVIDKTTIEDIMHPILTKLDIQAR